MDIILSFINLWVLLQSLHDLLQFLIISPLTLQLIKTDKFLPFIFLHSMMLFFGY